MKDKSQKIKPLTLVSGIITLIFGIAMIAMAFAIAYYFIALVMPGADAGAAEAFAFAIAGWIIIPVGVLLGLMGLAVAITNIVLGSIIIASAAKDDKKYVSRRGFIITTIVFDFIYAALLVVVGSQTLDSTFGIAILIFGILAIISAAIKITDLAIVSKRYGKVKEAIANVIPTAVVDFDALKSNEAKLKEELANIEKMKQEGTITEIGYEKLVKEANEKYGDKK